ncbi:MAG: NADP-dependent phosphogluconate dehydrogenase [Pseudomonadota bacterium]
MAKAHTGLVGLGTMGRNLALNIAEKGYPIAVFNRTTSVTRDYAADAKAESDQLGENIIPTETLEDFVAAMETPRNIILMVPAGPVVDKQMEALRPLLDKDDLIIDAGNALFEDTNRRAVAAHAAGEKFLGIGVSGGEEGARHGPSIMGGGDKDAWDRVADMLQAISAKYQAEDGTITPCATYMGAGGAGHFVKMVHNGIEYADMQMIAETYGIMRDGLGMTPAQVGDVFARWNEGPLQSYLIEISAEVSKAMDPKTGKAMLDVILDSAGQKGTGRWTAIEALKLGAPVTAIDAAVAARNLSSRVGERETGENMFGAAPQHIDGAMLSLDTLEGALLAGKIACYAQGFEMLEQASKDYDWNLPMPAIAEVWREGCIIRSAMLNDMASALTENPGGNLMNAPFFADRLKANHSALRQTAAQAVLSGCPSPALNAAVSYFDTMRTLKGTANMIQAQRDFFGAHGFKRRGEEGDHHGPWGSGLQTQ